MEEPDSAWEAEKAKIDWSPPPEFPVGSCGVGLIRNLPSARHPPQKATHIIAPRLRSVSRSAGFWSVESIASSAISFTSANMLIYMVDRKTLVFAGDEGFKKS